MTTQTSYKDEDLQLEYTMLENMVLVRLDPPPKYAGEGILEIDQTTRECMASRMIIGTVMAYGDKVQIPIKPNVKVLFIQGTGNPANPGASFTDVDKGFLRIIDDRDILCIVRDLKR